MMAALSDTDWTEPCSAGFSIGDPVLEVNRQFAIIVHMLNNRRLRSVSMVPFAPECKLHEAAQPTKRSDAMEFQWGTASLATTLSPGPEAHFKETWSRPVLAPTASCPPLTNPGTGAGRGVTTIPRPYPSHNLPFTTKRRYCATNEGTATWTAPSDLCAG